MDESSWGILLQRMVQPCAMPKLWPLSRHRVLSLLLICAMALFVRILVSLHSYSGAGDAPKFGDYEAQRHWMEITVHTPIKDWYRPSVDNDLSYWGLDYPPLTAYQSLVHGLVLKRIEPAAVALHSSRGYETPSSKILMRWTVLTSDLLIFFPAALVFVALFYRKRSDEERAWALTVILLQPALILIDHGHFQYNCISLGLAAGAAAALVAKKEVAASVLFCLSFNHKQMSMYYAPAFFAHLLGLCLRRKRPVIEVARLAFTVLLTVAVCWYPFWSREAALEVLQRLAPLKRGIFEDYVANFWCATSILAKWKQLFSIPALTFMSLGATTAAILPSMVQQICAPSTKGFVLAMLNSSLAFYLFAYQVHEKSILLPLLPATLLALEEPELIRWLVPIATFSMLPLLRRDGLLLPFVALLWLFYLICCRSSGPDLQDKVEAKGRGSDLVFRYVGVFSCTFAILLSLGYVMIPPPVRYPYLFDALIVSFCFLHLIPLVVYYNWCQWCVPPDGVWKEKVG